MDKIYTVLAEILNNRVIQIVMIAVVFDTIFGVIRAVRKHKFNSCFGIDGAIRKISMIVSITMLAIVDRLVKINLIGFVPEEARQFIGLEIIGTAEFFGLLYICYEVVSILKNMYLCGLPVHWVWKNVRVFLSKYTEELPGTEEIDTKQTSTGKTEVKKE